MTTIHKPGELAHLTGFARDGDVPCKVVSVERSVNVQWCICKVTAPRGILEKGDEIKFPGHRVRPRNAKKGEAWTWEPAYPATTP